MSESLNGTKERIAEVLRANRRFLVVTHVRPDGDAVGSILAMARILRRLGKVVDAVAQDPVPPNMEFVPEAETIRHDADDPSSYDAVVLVDCGDLKRVGAGLEGVAGAVRTIVNIDHHISEAPYGDAYWVWTGASSTCEMLYDLSQVLGVSLDPDLATQLYVGLVTDTGSFRYSNTNRRTLDIAAELVAAGANPYRVAEEVFDSSSPNALKLLSSVLSTVLFLSDERLATVEMTAKMFEETGSAPTDAEGIINHLRSVRSVRVAITFREGDDGLVHVSLRSKGDVDVAALARKFGGGGHRNAAGCRLAGAIGEVREKITGEALGILA